MNTILEQVLHLPTKEKLELYYALQDNLDSEIGEDELTIDQWNEVEKRYTDIENDSSQFMSDNEFIEKLNTLNNELRNKRS